MPVPTARRKEQTIRPLTVSCAQGVWDRAFATRILAASRRPENPLVVGIIGIGHLQFGGGVPWQLADLGLRPVHTLIAADADALPAPGAAYAILADCLQSNSD